MDKMIHNSLVATIPAFRRPQVIQRIIQATEITLEVNRVRKYFCHLKTTWDLYWKCFLFLLITDVEIQKIRQDKINPAYSPAQSEPESPGKLISKNNK